MELWTFSVRYIIDQWNNTPHKDLKLLTPNEVFYYINLDTITQQKQYIKKEKFSEVIN